MSAPRTSPKPHDLLYDDSGRIISWLHASYSLEDIKDEWDYLFENGEQLNEIWMAVRWTRPDELADEEVAFFLFGDVEMNDVDTSCVYSFAAAETPDAHRYWTTEPPVAAPSEGSNEC